MTNTVGAFHGKPVVRDLCAVCADNERRRLKPRKTSNMETKVAYVTNGRQMQCQPATMKNPSDVNPLAATGQTESKQPSPASTLVYPSAPGSAMDAEVPTSYVSPREVVLQHTIQIGALAAQLHSHIYSLCSHPVSIPSADETRRLCELARTLHRHTQDLCSAAVDLLDESYFSQR